MALNSHETGKVAAAALLAHIAAKHHEAQQTAKSPAARVDNRSVNTPSKPKLPNTVQVKGKDEPEKKDNPAEEKTENENSSALDKILAIIKADKGK